MVSLKQRLNIERSEKSDGFCFTFNHASFKIFARGKMFFYPKTSIVWDIAW